VTLDDVISGEKAPLGRILRIEELRSLITREKGDNYKNRHGVTVIL
jgi:hypothetical protein